MLKVKPSSNHRRAEQYVPLKNVAVEVNIHSFAAEVCIKQVFVNNEESAVPIEAVYCFPIEEQAAISSFEATIDDGRKIVGQIKEKTTAQRDYCTALKKGHGAFLLEQDEKSPDIFTVSVGSLQPQSKCEIEIRYVQELDLIDDGQRIQFTLPTTIAPRYSSVSAGDGHIKSPAATTTKYVQSAPYSIAFSCSIASLPVASVDSPSHPIQVTSQSNGTPFPTTNAHLTQENTHLDRDITLNIMLQQQQVLTYTLVEEQALMVSLVPTLALSDTSNRAGQVNCEYIFVVDCSGSMAEEKKIGYARQAMSVFIKSLPMGSPFNIIRFGSTYKKFEAKQMTVEYNEQSAQKAIAYVRRMQADLGGTELHSVLSHLQANPPQTNYSRQIFLLTDGEISDVDEVLRLCRSMSNTTPIFSFGLGSAPSRALVKGLARVTNGSYLFIPPNTHVDVAVARQLDKALEPCLVNVQVQCQFDDPQLQDYRISPKILPPVHVKQRLNVYVMMPKKIEGTLSGSLEFRNQANETLERVTFTSVQPASTSIATRLAAKSLITDLQTNEYDVNASRQARFIKQEIIDLSVTHQVLSPFTAFVAIETRSDQERTVAVAAEMILREVPIEINQSSSPTLNIACSPQYVSDCGNSDDEEEECEDEDDEECEIHDDDEEEEEEEQLATRKKRRQMIYSPTPCSDDDSSESSPSRSRSPRRRRSSGEDTAASTTDRSPDVIRQIIDRQKFTGLWSINDVKQIASLIQPHVSNAGKKEIDLEAIVKNFQGKDNDLILSVILICVFAKYFLEDESLWKPLVKKCSKVVEGRLGTSDYHQIMDKIKEMV